MQHKMNEQEQQSWISRS